MVACSLNQVWSIVHISPLSLGDIRSVGEFTCGGAAEFKLTHDPATSSYALAIDPGQEVNGARIQLHLDWFVLRQLLGESMTDGYAAHLVD